MGILLWLLSAAVLFLGQVVFPTPGFWHGVRPDLLGLFVIFWGFRRGIGGGIAAGIVAGLFQDSVGTLFLFHTVMLTLAGAGAGLARDKVVDFSQSAMPFVGTAFSAALRAAELLALLIIRVPAPSHPLAIIFLQAGVNLLAALALYPFTLALERKIAPPSLEFGARRLLN